MYTKPVPGQSSDWQSLYQSTPLDGLEIGEVATFTKEYFDLSKVYTLSLLLFIFVLIRGPIGKIQWYRVSGLNGLNI